MDGSRPAPAPRRGRRPDLDPVTERRLLLKAARRVLQRSESRQATLNDVLNEAQLSTRAFYRQFSSTTEMLAVLRTNELSAVNTRLEKAVAEASTPRAALEAWVDELLDLRFDPRRARMVSLVREGCIAGTELQSRVDAEDVLAPGVQRILEDGQAAGDFPRADPPADSRTICRIVLDFTAATRSTSRLESRDAVTAHVRRFVFGALT